MSEMDLLKAILEEQRCLRFGCRPEDYDPFYVTTKLTYAYLETRQGWIAMAWGAGDDTVTVYQTDPMHNKIDAKIALDKIVSLQAKSLYYFECEVTL